jgi:hypothetical protein
MEAKEKAIELVEKYAIWNWTETTCNYERAKQCALIAVDEIINYLTIIEQNETADFAFGGSYNGDDYFNYWQHVKQEIKKL